MPAYQSRLRRAFAVTNRIVAGVWKDSETGIPMKVACTAYYVPILGTAYVMECLGYRAITR